MPIKIALAGNPNSGKTTLFNELTGSSQYVGNWPGVTVEKKEGRLKGNKDVIITDLPGIYSLSPYTLEEVVTRNYLLDEKPDVIINLVDASNIERNLYLTTQLLELSIPVVIALNMMDIVKKNGDKIDVSKLSKELGCEIVEITAVKGEGINNLTSTAINLASKKDVKINNKFDSVVEEALNQIEKNLTDPQTNKSKRFFNIKVLERDEKVMEQLKFSSSEKQNIEKIINDLEEKLDDDTESIITNERYEYIGKIIEKTVKKSRIGMTASDKIDSIVTNRFLALPIFALIMWFVYYVSVSSLGAVVTDWTNDTLFGETIIPAAQSFLEGIGASDVVVGLICEGIIGGVGAVLGFVPQMMILFIFLAILEDCGYMARVAFIMDRIFRKFGLSGRSFIPMLISSGCGVPGVMASRTIENEKDRKMTIMVTTFIPCGAKLPIIALIAGALFPGSNWVAPFAYFLGIGAIIASGIILKKTKLFAGDPAPFVMELPQYHIPGIKSVLIHMWERSKSFIIKAGTVIFVSAGVIWLLSSFGFGEAGFGLVDIEESILATVGRFVSPIFAPLGFGNWQSTVATVTGLIAKENVVATFGVFFGIAEAAEDDPNLLLHISGMFTAASALSFMVFNLLCAPCFAAIGAIKREMMSWKWTFIAIGYQTLLAYVVSFVFYQLGAVITGVNGFGPGAVISIVLIVLVIWLLFRNPDSSKKLKTARAA